MGLVKKLCEWQSVASKKRWSNPLYLERMSIASKKRWSDPLFRAKQAKSRESSKSISSRMKKLWKNPDFRARMLKIRKAQAQRPEVRAKLSESAKKMWLGEKGVKNRKERAERWENPVYRKRMLKVWSGAYVRRNGTSWNSGQTKDTHPALRLVSKKYKGKIPDYSKYRTWYQGKDCRGRYRKILMRSSYEVAYAKYCDKKKIKWEYEPRWFSVGNGVWRGQTYTPDFFHPVSNLYVEIKGYLTEPDSLKMLKAVRRYQITLILLGKCELQALGVI